MTAGLNEMKEIISNFLSHHGCCFLLKMERKRMNINKYFFILAVLSLCLISSLFLDFEPDTCIAHDSTWRQLEGPLVKTFQRGNG